MKTKELMIYDWVRNCYGKNERVEQILESSVMLAYNETYYFGGIEWIEPIPLTAEILEKNGFVEGEFVKVGYKEIKLKNHNFTFNHPKYDIEVWEGELFLMRLPLNSVHELQHALRLCEFDKEVKL